MPRRGADAGDDITDDSTSTADGESPFGRASTRPRTPTQSSAPADRQAALTQPASCGTKLFEVVAILAIVAACKPVKDTGDLLPLRETLIVELGPAYMWLIMLSVVEWATLPVEQKAQHTNMWLAWLSSYSKASEAVLEHWLWKLLKKKTEAFAPLHLVFAKIRPGSPNCGTVAWTEIFLLYPITGASIAHKLLARGLKTCLGFKDNSTASCTDYIAMSINTSVSQLGHMPAMSVQDVSALVTLMGLYLSDASGHQKAYKELIAHVDDGNDLTLDTVQHVIIRFSHSKSMRVFALRTGDTRCTHACPRCCDRDDTEEACHHSCPRTVTTVAAHRYLRSKCTSSLASSSAGSPARADRNYSVSDLNEREQLWREQGIDEETRVFAALLY